MPLPPPGPGYSARCRPCNSDHRPEIDRRLLAGESGRTVSAWLLATHGEKIPHQALANHRTEHLDVHAEARAIVESATPAFAAAVVKVVADAAVLDAVASIGVDVAQKLAPIVSDPRQKPSQPIATAFAAALSNARGAVMDRHEVLHGKRVEVTGSVETRDPEALHARLAALVARATGRPDPGGAGGADGGGAG